MNRAADLVLPRQEPGVPRWGAVKTVRLRDKPAGNPIGRCDDLYSVGIKRGLGRARQFSRST